MKIYSKDNVDDNELGKFMLRAYAKSLYSDEIERWISDVHSTVESLSRVALMYGPTDSGKTTHLSRYKKKYIAKMIESSQYKDHIPFAEATMSSASTKHELLTLLLKSLKDIKPSVGTLAQKEERLQQKVQNLGVTMLMIDDFGRLLRDSGVSFNKKMCHYIQYLTVELLKIPCLLSGVDECRYIFDEMHELGRRTPFKYRLKAFRMDNKENTAEYLKFLKRLESMLPRKSPGFSDIKMAKRFLIAGNGVPGPIKTLYEQAYLITQDKGGAIRLADYELAYDRIHEASLVSEESDNQLLTKVKPKGPKKKGKRKRKHLQESYSYKAPFNPFRKGVNVDRMNKCIEAMYD